jgi:hypothetical protein
MGLHPVARWALGPPKKWARSCATCPALAARLRSTHLTPNFPIPRVTCLLDLKFSINTEAIRRPRVPQQFWFNAPAAIKRGHPVRREHANTREATRFFL